MGWLAQLVWVASLLLVGMVGRRSATATGSSQWGQGAPGPMRRQNWLQSSQRWLPR